MQCQAVWAIKRRWFAWFLILVFIFSTEKQVFYWVAPHATDDFHLYNPSSVSVVETGLNMDYWEEHSALVHLQFMLAFNKTYEEALLKHLREDESPLKAASGRVEAWGNVPERFPRVPPAFASITVTLTVARAAILKNSIMNYWSIEFLYLSNFSRVERRDF